MVSKWSYQGWLLSLEMTASKGFPKLRSSECQSYFVCIYTRAHSLYFRACLGRKFMGFFQMQGQPCTEQQTFHSWRCVQSCASYLTLPFLHSLSDQRNEAYMHEQRRESLGQAVGAAKWFHHRAMTALLTAPLVSPHASSDVVPSSILPCCVREQDLAGTAVGLLRDRAALSSCSSCPVEPGSIWGLRRQQDLLANV